MNPDMPRREFLSKAALGTAAAAELVSASASLGADKNSASASGQKKPLTARDYLKSILYRREEV